MAGVGKLNHGGVAPQNSRLFLLAHAGFDELRSGDFGGSASPIRGDHTGKVEVVLSTTGADAGKGHDFEVIGVGANAEVGGGGEGRGEVTARCMGVG